MARQTRSLAGGASGPTLQCWPVGLMDKMSARGAGNLRFESWAGHLMRLSNMACTGDRKVHREPQSARVRALAEQRAPDTTYVGSADASGIRHVPPLPPPRAPGRGRRWASGWEVLKETKRKNRGRNCECRPASSQRRYCGWQRVSLIILKSRVRSLLAASARTGEKEAAGNSPDRTSS